MSSYLVVIAVILFACVLLNQLSFKLGIPTLLAFICLGMLFGEEGLFKIRFEDFAFGEQICTAALIFIMFYGGFGTRWKQAKPVAPQAVLLASAGVVLTAALIGIFAHFAFSLSWPESFLIGSVISSTDAASVFSILRSKKLHLKYNTASLLEMESGSNDPCSYMLTAICIAWLKGTASGVAIIEIVFAQVLFGILFGAAIAGAAVFIMRRMGSRAGDVGIIFTVAVAILSYAAPSLVGGNGYLSTYIVGIVLGNSEIHNKKNLVHFFDGVTGIMQIVIFFLLGLLASPSHLPDVAKTGVLISLFVIFIARPAAVFAVLVPFGARTAQSLLVSWTGLRGAASIVFAIGAFTQVSLEYDLYHIVFFIVLASILLQGSLIPFFADKLGMTGGEEDVMKTFTDYTEEVPVQFIECIIPEEHPWNGKAVRDILFPPTTLLVMLRRKGRGLIPNGDTVLYSGDHLVLSAFSPEDMGGIRLSEMLLEEGNKKIGKRISELSLLKNTLIIMIQRNGKIIIPRGNVVLQQNDLLVMSSLPE